jgi:hypothetical protein
MIEKLIRALVVGVVLYIVFIVIGAVVSAVGLPSLVTVLAGVVLALVFCGYVLRLFGITL